MLSPATIPRAVTHERRTAPPFRRRWSPPLVGNLVVCCVIAVAAWLPFLSRPLGSDEGGFLFLSQHWTPGTSLYGNYWVDRPPVLLWLFDVADHLGGVSPTLAGLSAPGVKLLGGAASGVAVLLAGMLARLLTDGPWVRAAAPVVAVALLSDPLLGMPETNGEVLATPLVLASVVCVVLALRRRPGQGSALVLSAGAGAAAMAAALVKQNVVDGFVFATVCFLLARGRIGSLRHRIGAFVVGAGVVLATAVGAAAARGTSPAGLWGAVVLFRVRASEVISSSASSATPLRAEHVALAFLVSGAAVILLVTAALALASLLKRRRRRALDGVVGGALDLTWPILAMVTWELLGVALGGSYWLHYLTGLVPGLVALVTLTGQSPRRARFLTACLLYVVVVSATMWTHTLTRPVRVTPDDEVVSYLRAHAHRGDGVVVGFGHPGIVAAAGLPSPYPELWSLPVRVRDPELSGLLHVLSGRQAPRWVVVAGGSLDTWGVRAGAAQHYLERHYVDQITFGNWNIWLRDRDVTG